MGLPKLKTKISVKEYLEGEDVSDKRHEFIDGEIYLVAGASDNHNIIAGNLFANLWGHLRDNSCQIFMENMKLKASEDKFYYPDIFVACDQSPESRFYREEPILIIEVISPSTREIDRREKLNIYQRIPTVQEYIIIEQEKIQIELHRRQDDGRWITYFYNKSDLGKIVEFESVEMQITPDEIYRRVEFENK